ncbi:hypothetical protein DSM109990_03367 (plasmid) [Sulfitobacter dubius]|uniref:Uncharacterized protein n=1 Tax=Sulfitobacter dubius TaxID=218673 RepID=A0ABY3ZQQ5_9RHOB|nr:hypothetical protein DSM109990_03367 [Sulfitobacter dubius]
MRKYVPAIMKRTEAAATDFALSVNSACSELQHLLLKESSGEDIKNVYPQDSCHSVMEPQLRNL